MNPTAFLMNLLSPGLPALLNIYRQTLNAPRGNAFSASGNPFPTQFGPYAGPDGNFGGGQILPFGGLQGGNLIPAIPAIPVTPVTPAFPVQGAYPPAPQQGTAINFRPVIVQNQTNVLPLRATGGINATMNAGTSLNVNGTGVFT